MVDNDQEQEGVREELEAHHKARTEVAGRDDVDARLDNRSPEQMSPPPLPEGVTKPQQVNGPDLEHQAEWTKAEVDRRSGKKAKRAEAKKDEAPKAEAPKTTTTSTHSAPVTVTTNVTGGGSNKPAPKDGKG